MKNILIISWLVCVQLVSLGQEEKQIKSRGIRVVRMKTEQLQKDQREVFYEVSTYDKKGREVFTQRFSSDSICIRSEQFVYNKKGKTTQHCISDSLAQKTTCTIQNYDRWNRLTEKKTLENNLIVERTEYGFNNFDDKTEEITYDSKGRVKKKTTYTYDNRGMLTRKHTENGGGVIIFEKTIDYTY